MKSLVLVRHGQSVWNREGRFTGWTDVDLTDEGIAEARAAGRQLREAGLSFDVAFTSVLKRAIRTLWLALDELDRMWLPVHNDWRLNERHYGNLQGLDKGEMARRFGDAQVKVWRRSYDTPPPPLAADDPRRAAERADPRYAALAPHELPAAESLADTVARFLPCWEQRIAPALRAGQRVLIVAHGNSLRALKMHLDSISREAIAELNIPTGIPEHYELDDRLRPLNRRYLGDPAAAAAAAQRVADQGRARG